MKKEKKEAIKAKGLPGKASDDIKEVAAILKFNSSIRRHASRLYIQALKDAGTIKEEDSIFIQFEWDRVKIIVNGLARDVWYTEHDLIIAIAGSIKCVADEVSNKLSIMMKENNIQL